MRSDFFVSQRVLLTDKLENLSNIRRNRWYSLLQVVYEETEEQIDREDDCHIC